MQWLKLFTQVLLSCLGVWICQALPLRQKRGHYFVFWKTTSQELVPLIKHLHGKTHDLMREYFREGLVKRDGESSLDSARHLYEGLNLTTFPSAKVLDKENKTQFIFIKNLLKESYRLSHTYRQVLKLELNFRCSLNDSLSRDMCEETKDLHNGLNKVFEGLTEQFTKTEKTDRKEADRNETETITSASDNVNNEVGEADYDYYDTGRSRDASMVLKYRRRNQESVAVLFALYVHLKNTEGSLNYAIKQLRPIDTVSLIDAIRNKINRPRKRQNGRGNKKASLNWI